MRVFVYSFLLFVTLYHGIVAYLSFGAHVVPPYTVLVIRDIGWLLAIFVLALLHKKVLFQHIAKRANLRLLFLLLLVVSIVTSCFLGVDTTHMVVGIKYSFYYIVPLLTAVYIGNIRASRYTKEECLLRVKQVWWLVVVILLAGWVRQITKNIYPEWFYSFGYGPLGDYVFGARPPLYYLTGPHGFQRRSGLFSGPNNYGYFLVVLFAFYWYGIRSFIADRSSKVLLRALYSITLLATLSRGAVLGVLIQIVLISFVLYQTKKRLLLGAVLSGLAMVAGLSALKRQSTLAHLQAKFSGLFTVQQSIRGFGLGSSGPSVHSQGGYLPENFFIQLLMDLGIHGFLIRSVFRIVFLFTIRTIYKNNSAHRFLIFSLTVGFVGIMVEGLFLHVLEDSMVNYFFFILRGIVIGYMGERE